MEKVKLFLLNCKKDWTLFSVLFLVFFIKEVWSGFPAWITAIVIIIGFLLVSVRSYFKYIEK